MIKYFVI